MKNTRLFVLKSALFRASRALADSEGRWDPCPVPSPGPDLCQEGTQDSGGGPEPHLPSLSTEATTKGSLWKVGLGMKGKRLNRWAGPSRKLAGDTVASELPSGAEGGGQRNRGALALLWPVQSEFTSASGIQLPWGRLWGWGAGRPRAAQAL